MYENSTYNKNNIPNKWEKGELCNRFVGEMANHLQKNLGPQCTPQVQIHSRGINPSIYFLTYKNTRIGYQNIFYNLRWGKFSNI